MNIIDRFFRIVLTIILTITLASCDSGNINKVKDSVFYDIDTSMTIGKAFSTRTDCERGKWSEEKDARGRSIVTYTCSLPERYLEHVNDITFSSLDRTFTIMTNYIASRMKVIESSSLIMDKYRKKLIDLEQANKDKNKLLTLEKVDAYTKWMVTDSGGVELVSSEIASHYGNKTVTIKFNQPKEAVALAYADFREDRIPTMYINAMKKSVQKDYDAFVSSISNNERL
ncbi:hypothetical protein [Budvicia aquatica]|uniref:Uncharacterized protein n=1 Tax=Budvicia aquatica TaxID=82979 RepID=A0A2C6DP25_9GAMM|nr:hypothetical protein [Budvicia aquatica]PHI30967.1 hypothetical protein CRN84_17315 [Budvicia aquatica]VFS51035.1 Uncharacterised protein [Budvicia aquatica]